MEIGIIYIFIIGAIITPICWLLSKTSIYKKFEDDVLNHRY